MLNKAQDDDLVMGLVEQVLGQPLDDRECYLKKACSGDSDLFDRVWKYVQWEQRMKGFLLEPLCQPEGPDLRFAAGELLDGRFRIVREVASGGMGIVYEAIDERLNRRIALKCAKAGFNSRLPPEVRHATQISHPNVCKTYEIHTASTRHGEIDFLTMEFLEGETLAARLKRGTPSAPEANLIARQLCAGLAEAHRNRVIHGDLKSSNVILTTGADGGIRAVITDFGLARQPETVQPALPSGAQGGTPDYMAPELWKGSKATIASDIYALGVILYELACGRRPFNQEQSGPASSPGKYGQRRLAPANSKWDRILARCLDADPLRRYRTVGQLELALGPSPSRRRILAASFVAAIAFFSAVVTYQRATMPKESVRLAVLPFEAGQDTAPIADGLARDTARQLKRLKSSARTRFALVSLPTGGGPNTADTARLAATHWLHGTLTRETGKLIVHAYLTDARSQVNAKEWIAEYAPTEVRFIPAALAGMVTETLRLPALPVSAVNSAAFRDYNSGLTYLRRDSSVDLALAFMERAVAEDPDSPLTHCGLAEAQWFKYFLGKDRAWLDRATGSVREAARRQPDSAAVHRIQGKIDESAGQYEQAEAEYSRAIELDPGNDDGHRRLGQVLERIGRSGEALAAYRHALDAAPGNYRTYQALGNFYFVRANYREAASYFSKTVELAPEQASAHHALGRAWMSLGRFADAESELRFAIHLQQSWDLFHELGQILVYERRDREAIQYFLAALNLRRENYFSLMQLGDCYRRMKQNEEAEKAYRTGLQLTEAEMSRNPRDGYLRSFLAYFCARLGDRTRAESEIAQALQLSSNAPNVQWMAVASYEVLRSREASLAVLSTAPADLLADLGRWPDVEDLCRDRRFIQLAVLHRIK